MMTLDEAIQHCEEVAEEAKSTPCIKGGLVQKCGEEHAQLAVWLKQLRKIETAYKTGELYNLIEACMNIWEE